MFLCIWYLFEQISARVFLIHLFFYAGFYCTLKVCRCQDLLVLDGVYTRLKKGGEGGQGTGVARIFSWGGQVILFIEKCSLLVDRLGHTGSEY